MDEFLSLFALKSRFCVKREMSASVAPLQYRSVGRGFHYRMECGPPLPVAETEIVIPYGLRPMRRYTFAKRTGFFTNRH
jgi:hypothetical protein